MSVKKLCRAELTTSAATYVSGDSSLRQITAATVTNNSGSTANLDVYIVDSGGANTDANARVINTKAVLAGETVGLSELVGQSIDKNETLEAKSSAASALVLFISGNENAG